jgi:NAD(P)-dependent dehydrogenase (short-subunit alcohol dehydrogenase family)
MEKLRFDGRVAIVTGAGRGLGRAHAVLLASRGARVVVNDIVSPQGGKGVTASPADEVVREIINAGGQAVASCDSVATPEGAVSIVKTAIEAYGRVDILIHNAGICDWAPFSDLDYDQFQRMRQVHYDGPWLLTHAAWPHMVRQNYGRILFITSHVGLAGMPNCAHYGSAKWASAGLSRMLSFEGGSADIKSNALGVLAYTRLLVKGFFTPEAAEDPPGAGAPEDHSLLIQNERWWSRNVRPDQVAPVVAWLVHERCHLNGDILDTGAGHTFRHILSTTEGYVKADLTLEDVDEHMTEILDDRKTNVWSSVDKALQNRLKKLQLAGVDPMDTVYPS